MGIGESVLMSVLGMAVVFLVLCILIVVIKITSSLLGIKQPAGAAAASPAAPSAPAAVKTAAGGSAGRVKTFDVPDATAALVMSVVADKLDVPLNQLRFISIRESAV